MNAPDDRAVHHHSRAAFHHETAAFHHRQAAAHRAEGRDGDADRHLREAADHGRWAYDQASEADRYSAREVPDNEFSGRDFGVRGNYDQDRDLRERDNVRANPKR